MQPLVWTDALCLGLDWLDADHTDAVHQMAALAAADDTTFPKLFQSFAQHLAEHFAREERLMEAVTFPAMPCHQGEHRRVLDLVAGLEAKVGAGDLAAARNFIAEDAPAWFLDHRNTMDFVTVAYARQAGHTV